MPIYSTEVGVDWDAFDEWCDLYLRMSQDNELGIDRQEVEARQHAARLGLRVRHVWLDNKKSATRENVRRDDFEECLSEATARRVRLKDPERYSKIVCWHSDRFARRVKDLLRIQEASILVYGKESGYFDLSQPAGVATAITVTAWAEYEGKQKALRQKASHRQRAGDGRHFWTQRPFGLEFDGTLRQDEADALRTVYSMILNGVSLNECARMLNEAGLPTVKGGQWQGSVLRNVLKHARNCGILVYNGVEIGPGKWERIVDEDTFRATVQLLMDPVRLTSGKRSGRGAKNSMLSGFALCSVCLDTISTQRVTRSDGSKYRIYRCRQGGHVTARADFVDEHAAAVIIDRFSLSDAVERASAGSGDGELIEAEIARLEQKAEGYEAALDADEMTQAQFTRLNSKNLARIRALRKELAKAGLDKNLRELLDVPDLAAHWQNDLSIAARAAIVEKFFDRILIYPRGQGAGRFLPGRAKLWIKGEKDPVEIGGYDAVRLSLA